MLDTQETGGSSPSLRTEDLLPYCKSCKERLEPMVYKDGERVEDAYWHTMYRRLRLGGCEWSKQILHYDPIDPGRGRVEFR